MCCIHYIFHWLFAERPWERCSVDSLQHISIRYACLGCWSRQAFHAMHSVHSCENTQCIRNNSELFPRSCRCRSRHNTDCMHNFAVLIPPKHHFVKDTTKPTAVLILAQLLLQLYYCIYGEVKIILRRKNMTFLRHLVPAKIHYYFPATPDPRLTHSQKPNGTILVLYTTPPKINLIKIMFDRSQCSMYESFFQHSFFQV